MNLQRSVILLGPPGSGKGTQARELSRMFRVPHISTGDMMRKAARQPTVLGQATATGMLAGALVPDDLVCSILADRLAEPDCLRGFVLDGFPRTIGQAEFLYKLLGAKEQQIRAVVNLRVSKDVLIKRIMGRMMCPVCGEIYNAYFRPPKIEGKCDLDSKPLERRSDDNEDTIHKRLGAEKNQCRPLINYYRTMKLLQEVNASVGPTALTARISELLRNPINGNEFAEIS